MKLTEQQNEILKECRNPSGHLGIKARAGCGKTSMVKLGVAEAPESSIACLTFANRNKEDLMRAITDSRVVCSGFNGAGFKLLIRAWGGGKFNVSGDWAEINRIKVVNGDKTPWEVINPIKDAVNWAKNTCVKFPTLGEIEEICKIKCEIPDNFQATFTPGACAGIVERVLKLSLDRSREISWNDQIWLPLILGLIKPTYPLVFVDEAQDQNPVNLEMAIKLCSGRLGLVFDDRQKIYGFRGAVNSIPEYLAKLNAKTLPLTKTFRCPKSVVARAKGLVPDYEAHDANIDGAVNSIGQDAMMENATGGDAILSRTNAPLMKIALGFLKSGKPARIEGKDIGKGLLDTIKKIGGNSIDSFLSNVDTYRTSQIAKIPANFFNQEKIDWITDSCATLETLAESCNYIPEIESKINRLFSNTGDWGVNTARQITCSTIHKAKGLEWHNTFLLASTLKSATEEDNNVHYVGLTRCKNALNLVV